ncbi:hypothetical protein N7988_28375 (plasmid) [Bacillus cereus]|uniref:hypothetical protein n=1 Tax=Bacillus cereus group TaxID=86661 RepID=UPI00080F623A|nr:MULTISPECIES: hypothetical protein [Bacillus cereus group]ANV74525.1 hypothetical protein BCM43_28425 [Bacillus thuringiensis]MCU7756947.1 hypothetical protein [Bacillus cereus]MDC7752588.1 hypothetical protein [Bacillus cereus]UXP17425.1 hypothetical protein N7988_28375 [Bacillus cereus]
MIEVLEFVVLLILNMLLTFIVLLQDYCIATIKLAYYKIILATAILIRLLLSLWIVYSTTATLLDTLKILAIQSIVLLCLWVLSQCVRKYAESWYITIIALIVYGISFYFHIMYAKTV